MGEGNGAFGILDRLLAYASTPWKAVVIIILVVIGGAGYLIWHERARLADYVLTRVGTTAALDEAAFVAEAPRLLRETKADFAMLVELNLDDNLMTERVGMDADGNRWIPTIGPQRALEPASSMPILVKFLSNEVACQDTADAVSIDGIALAQRGYVRLCLVAVPPILGINVGALALAWFVALSRVGEDRASIAMKSAALRFATW